MIPIENSVAGRVADIHHLLPDAGLYIVGEHFLRVRHQLMARRARPSPPIKTVLSQTQALGQCRKILRELGLTPLLEADTAGAARMVGEPKRPALAAIASRSPPNLRARILCATSRTPTTTRRASSCCREADDAEQGDGPVITTFIFRVRNVPAALYKALGGFATNGVNMTKLEAISSRARSTPTISTPTSRATRPTGPFRLALEELSVLLQREPHPRRLQGQSPAQGAGQAERRRPHQGSHELTWTCAGYGLPA